MEDKLEHIIGSLVGGIVWDEQVDDFPSPEYTQGDEIVLVNTPLLHVLFGYPFSSSSPVIKTLRNDDGEWTAADLMSSVSASFVQAHAEWDKDSCCHEIGDYILEGLERVSGNLFLAHVGS